MTALIFQTGGGHQTSPASIRLVWVARGDNTLFESKRKARPRLNNKTNKQTKNAYFLLHSTKPVRIWSVITFSSNKQNRKINTMILMKFDLFVLQLAEKLAAECKRRMQAWNGNYSRSIFIISSSSCVSSFSSVFTDSRKS